MLKRLAVAALVVVLAGCGGTSGEKSDANPQGSNADKPAASEETTQSPEPEAANPKFGQTYTWDDGMSVVISKPQSFTPSEYAGVEGATKYVKFGVRLVNKTGKPFDPALVYATLQSGNEEAEAVYDSENSIGESPSTKLLDGREAKWVIGFAVNDPADLVLEISPDAGMEYEGAIYTN